MKTRVELIAEERQRQIEVEGWTLEDAYNEAWEHAIAIAMDNVGRMTISLQKLKK